MPPESLENRLAEPIAAFAVGNYSLLSDLNQLQAVRQAGANEAVIFYSARILEILTASAVQRVGLTPSASAFSNLETLVQLNLARTTTMYWGNALRRLGNDVRHILRRTASHDADLAVLFVERWIEWFFGQFRFGPRLEKVTRDGEPILFGGDFYLSHMLREMDAEDFDPAAWIEKASEGGDSPFMVSSTMAAVVVNLLLDRGDAERGIGVLEPAMAKFPEDLRLQQLAVFAWKRQGKIDKAIALAQTLAAKSRDDDETAGIVAGVYKQVYLDKRDVEMLNKSHRAYLAGWEGSRASNAYLGINAAATALWLGRAADSRRLAEEVRQLLRKRLSALCKMGDAQMLEASYWDEVALAEAELLVGELIEARRRYQQAFKQWSRFKGNVKVASDQARRHLPLLGLGMSPEDFFRNDQEPIAVDDRLTIGVTGHRTLTDEAMVRSKIVEAIGRLKQMKAGVTKLVALSPLAAGADSLVADVVLEDFAGRLKVVLPLEIADYKTDFDEGHQARFAKLMNRADGIVFTPPTAKLPKAKGAAVLSPADERNASYERAGFYVADQCDALVAVWDGQAARGRGGTAEIVAYARKKRKPLAWIKSQAPYDLVIENV